MAFLLRLELPDVPGSLGAVATALGSAGADIEAIEIVERRSDGRVVDDVLLELPPTVMPDALVTACHGLDGVAVQWISRYTAGANLSLDLEAIEQFTAEPSRAIESMVEVLPTTFRSDWAVAFELVAGGEISLRAASSTAPELVPTVAVWAGIGGPQLLPSIDEWPSTVLAGAPGKDRDGNPFVVVLGRHGGPEFLASEVIRFGHMVSLAASVAV